MPTRRSDDRKVPTLRSPEDIPARRPWLISPSLMIRRAMTLDKIKMLVRALVEFHRGRGSIN